MHCSSYTATFHPCLLLCDGLHISTRWYSWNTLPSKFKSSICLFFGFSKNCIVLKVYNILPSISAITGITPQTYLWRVSIALHIGPRLLIASVYYSYYKQIIMTIKDPSKRSSGQKLLNICYWLNVLEVASLCGVTYISNKENYGM